MIKPLIIIISIGLLSACSPLSYVSYVAAGGVALQAHQDAKHDAENEQFIGKCMPTHHMDNPMIMGEIKENQGSNVDAFYFYSAADKLHYPAAKAALARVSKKMSEKELNLSRENVKKYTTIHLTSCFYPAE